MSRTVYTIIITSVLLTLSLAILGGVVVRRKIETYTLKFDLYSEEIKTPRVASDSGNIIIEEPYEKQAVSMPFTVAGFASVFENMVNLRLIDSKGLVLVKTWVKATTEGIGQRGPFKKRLFFVKSDSKVGTLEVFSISPKDGSEIDKIEIPLKFSDTKTARK